MIRCQVYADRIELTLSQDRLAHWLNGDIGKDKPTGTSVSDSEPRLTMLSIPAGLKRAGKEMKIIVDDESDPRFLTRASSACSSAPTPFVNDSLRTEA